MIRGKSARVRITWWRKKFKLTCIHETQKRERSYWA